MRVFAHLRSSTPAHVLVINSAAFLRPHLNERALLRRLGLHFNGGRTGGGHGIAELDAFKHKASLKRAGECRRPFLFCPLLAPTPCNPDTPRHPVRRTLLVRLFPAHATECLKNHNRRCVKSGEKNWLSILGLLASLLFSLTCLFCTNFLHTHGAG